MPNAIRLGVDLGGTKLEIIALDADGRERLRRRRATPRDGYVATLEAVALLVGRERVDPTEYWQPGILKKQLDNFPKITG